MLHTIKDGFVSLNVTEITRWHC